MSVPSRDGHGRRLVDVDELATYFGRDRRWVYRMHEKGLPRFRLGRSCVYRIADVEAWLERHLVGDARDDGGPQG